MMDVVLLRRFATLTSLPEVDDARLAIDPSRPGNGATTVKVLNVPRKASAKLFLALLDARHAGTYDTVFFPLDFEYKQNFGIAYVNFVDPSHVWTFFGCLHGRAWEQFPFEAPMFVQYGELQGGDELHSHFADAAKVNQKIVKGVPLRFTPRVAPAAPAMGAHGADEAGAAAAAAQRRAFSEVSSRNALPARPLSEAAVAAAATHYHHGGVPGAFLSLPASQQRSMSEGSQKRDSGFWSDSGAGSNASLPTSRTSSASTGDVPSAEHHHRARAQAQEQLQQLMQQDAQQQQQQRPKSWHNGLSHSAGGGGAPPPSSLPHVDLSNTVVDVRSGVPVRHNTAPLPPHVPDLSRDERAGAGAGAGGLPGGGLPQRRTQSTGPHSANATGDALPSRPGGGQPPRQMSEIARLMGRLDLEHVDVDQVLSALPRDLVASPFLLLSTTGHVLYISAVLFRSMLGGPAAGEEQARAELRGIELQSRLHPLEREAVMGVLDTATKTGQPFELVMNLRVGAEGRFALLGGEGQKMELTLPGGNGQALPCLAMVITEVRAAEDELVRPRVPGSFFSRHSASGVYLQASPTVEQVLGFKASDLNGHSAYQMYHPEDCERVSQMHQGAAGSQVTVLYRHATRWGQYQWLEMMVKPVINAQARKVEYIMCQHKVVPPPL